MFFHLFVAYKQSHEAVHYFFFRFCQYNLYLLYYFNIIRIMFERQFIIYNL